MYVKFISKDLNHDSCSPYSTNTYTYGVIITPREHDETVIVHVQFCPLLVLHLLVLNPLVVLYIKGEIVHFVQ